MSNLLVVGRTGTGKTYMIKKLMKFLIQNDDRLIWLSNDLKDIDVPNQIEINSNDVSYRKLLNAYSQIGITYGHLTADEVQSEIDKLCQVIWSMKDDKKRTFLVIDEASEFYAKFKHSKNLERLIRAGRKNGISVLMLTQMIIDLDLSFLKQCSYLIVFAVSEQNDIEKVSKNLDIPVESLKELSTAEHTYIVKNLITGEVQRGYE